MFSDDTDLRNVPFKHTTLYNLTSNGFKTIGDLRNTLDRDLLAMPNFGRKKLEEVRYYAPGPSRKPRFEPREIIEILDHGDIAGLILYLGIQADRDALIKKMAGDVYQPYVRQEHPAAIKTAARNEQIYQQRLNGETYVSIGKQHGLSGDRARQIYERQARIVKSRAP